jgi:signal transduction histidine kinase
VQIDGSISRKHGGVGLGLALVKRFVELHGGRVWVKANPEKGSIFTFRIPKNSQNTIQENTNPVKTSYNLDIEREEEKIREEVN